MPLGLLFSALGVVLLLWAWGNWIYRSSTMIDNPASIPDHASAAKAARTTQAVQASPFVLMVGLLLILLFLVGSVVIVRSARRFRESVLHKKPPPTEADDVWAMHKLRETERDEGV